MLSSGSVKGNVLYVVGGSVLTPTTTTHYGTTELYTVAADAWTTGALRNGAHRPGIRINRVLAAMAGARMPTLRSTGCVATVGNDLYYSGAANTQTSTEMVAFEKISGTAVMPTATPMYVPCSVMAPANGGLGTCTSSLALGATCQPTCDAGYGVSGATSCSAGGVLTAATCATGVWISRNAVPAMSYYPLQGTGTYDTLMYTYTAGTKFASPADRGQFYKYTSPADTWTTGPAPLPPLPLPL